MGTMMINGRVRGTGGFCCPQCDGPMSHKSKHKLRRMVRRKGKSEWKREHGV